MVGPFIKYAPATVEAALAAGCHYTDTTGEQDWTLMAQERWGAKFAAKNLLLSPGIAQMYTTGEIAANLCLETPGLDTLDILVLWKGFPTYASTQTIFTILKASWYYLEQNKFVEWDLTTNYEVSVPGRHENSIVVPWGGTAHPVWFKNDPRVSNCRVLGGVLSRQVMEGVVATQKMVKEQIKPLPHGATGEGARRHRRLASGQHAAARKPAPQFVGRLGSRLGTARARALRHPRQLQLQTDGDAASLHGLLVAAGGAEAGRVRLGLPGVRAPRSAWGSCAASAS